MIQPLQCYKAVRVFDDKLYSYSYKQFSVNYHPWVEYVPGKWTHRRFGHGPLAVFNDPSAAYSFVTNGHSSTNMHPLSHPNARVYTAEYIPSAYNRLWYYETVNSKRKRITMEYHLPIGTEFAEAVKLGRPIRTSWELSYR